MPRSLGTFATVIAAATLSSCASAPKQVVIPPATVSTSIAETPSAFKPGDTILLGIEVADSPDDWQIGQRVRVVFRPSEGGPAVPMFTAA